MIDTTATVVDNGLFVELALRLSREFAQVNYWSPWEIEFPTINDRAIGDGYEEITRVEDPLDDEVVDASGLYVFPDIFHTGKQAVLKRLGKPVWGSFRGDQIETDRIWLRELQEELGLPVPEYEVIDGVPALRDYLKKQGRCFVKTTSKLRGTMETWEHLDYKQSQFILDELTLTAGPFAEHLRFVVEQPIESPFETGLDTYCVDGRFPRTPMQGIEIKGKFILCSAQTESQTPEPYDRTLEALSPVLAKFGYRNFLSLEFRQDILIDPCCRCPNPGIGAEMEMIRNLGEIIYEGANGNLVEPVFDYEFGCQAAIFHTHPDKLWKQFQIPKHVRKWVKLMEQCQVDGYEQNIPRPPHGAKIGWLIGVGHTIEEMAEHLMENADALKDFPFEIHTNCLDDALKQVHELEESGMEFTDQTVPEPPLVEKLE